MDVAKAVAHGPHKSEVNEYTNRDVIIYALGVGATGGDELQYLYENDSNFCALPTFVAAQGLKEIPLTEWPGVQPELTRILHGEEFIEVFASIPTDDKIRSEVKVVDVLDKGSGAVILYEVTTFNAESDEKIARQQCSIFQKGSGNFGGSRKSPYEIPALAPPQREPDQCVEQKTEINQASLYRLGSGDLNPLHIDPEFAQLSGFDQPILHGMCSLGFSVRHVLKTYAGNNVTFFKNLKARFSGVVLPGQTLCTQMWKEGNRIHFETLVKETGKKAISSAYVDLETTEVPPVENKSDSQSVAPKMPLSKL